MENFLLVAFLRRVIFQAMSCLKLFNCTMVPFLAADLIALFVPRKDSEEGIQKNLTMQPLSLRSCSV